MSEAKIPKVEASEDVQGDDKEVGENVTEVPAAEPAVTTRQTLDEAHRCMALKQWEKAADQYAVALEALSEQHAEDAPILAPTLHRYGRCLLEHAIATSGALGGGGGGAGASEAPLPKRKAETAGASSSSSKPADPRFSFGGDAEEEEEDEEDGGDAEGQDTDGTDDLSTAFAVLDLARIIYQRLLKGDGKDDMAEDTDASLETLDGQKWEYIKIKTELAEVLNDLGDVGLESEDFSQAASDYESSLTIISPFVSPHSRRLADAYLRLGLALEFHPEPERQASASKYVNSAANALKARLEALQSRQSLLSAGDEQNARAQAAAAKAREEKALAESRELANGQSDSNGKGKEKTKSSQGVPTERDDVAGMDEVKVAKEIKDVEEMLVELNAKLEEYNIPTPTGVPSSSGGEGSSSAAAVGMAIPDSAKLALKQAINDAFLGASTNSFSSTSGRGTDKPVTDITGMVKRKKRPVEAEGEGIMGEAAAPAADGPSSSWVEAEKAAAGTAVSLEPESKKAKVEDGQED